MAKFRNVLSYHGNSPEMIKHQRDNLIPGNAWQKRRTKELRLNCWWEYGELGDKQRIFEGYENKRDLKDIPKEELKNEEYLNNWCGSRTDHKSNSRGFSGVKSTLVKVARALPGRCQKAGFSS